MKAITILRYMTDHVDSLPLGVTTRLVITHDVPILFIQLVGADFMKLHFGRIF
jgi:hypothetical protein